MESGQRFEPEALTISVNETVTFVNESGDAHTVTAYEDALPEGASEEEGTHGGHSMAQTHGAPHPATPKGRETGVLD